MRRQEWGSLVSTEFQAEGFRLGILSPLPDLVWAIHGGGYDWNPPGMWACGWQYFPLWKWDLGPSCQVREAVLHWGALQGPILRSDQVLLLSVASPSPTFLKVCPPSSIPPGESLPGWSWVPVCVGEGGDGCTTHRRSQLPLDAEKSNFLPNCHRPRSLPSQPTSAWRRCVSLPRPPHAPYSCFPLPTPRRTLAPLLGHPCQDAPYIMSAVGRGLGSGRAPALGSLTKSSFSAADDRLWEQQLELRKEVSPLS